MGVDIYLANFIAQPGDRSVFASQSAALTDLPWQLGLGQFPPVRRLRLLDLDKPWQSRSDGQFVGSSRPVILFLDAVLDGNYKVYSSIDIVFSLFTYTSQPITAEMAAPRTPPPNDNTVCVLRNVGTGTYLNDSFGAVTPDNLVFSWADMVDGNGAIIGSHKVWRSGCVYKRANLLPIVGLPMAKS